MWNSFFEDYGEPKLEGFDLSDLKIDDALVDINSVVDEQVFLFKKSSLCYGCPFSRENILSANGNQQLVLNTDQYWSFLVSRANESYIFSPEQTTDPSTVCLHKDLSLGQFGVYRLLVSEGLCSFDTVKEPVFKYGAVILAFVVLSVLFAAWNIIQLCWKKNRSKKKFHFGDSLENAKINENERKPRGRLKSLDTFRGITIALMILVNHGGGGYWFLQHAPWDGLRTADVIFPWFVWIMGVCIPIGISSQIQKEIPKWKILRRIVIRSVKLFAIGIILNSIGGHNKLETYRIGGVLQRLAIGYLVTGGVATILYPGKNRIPLDGFFSNFDDIILLFPQWVVHLAIVFGHTIIIFLMDVPACPRGYLGAGGMSLFQNGTTSPDCIGGATKAVDVLILGVNHLYPRPTAKSIYEASAFDPEGILGCLPTIFQVFLGVQAGQILKSYSSHSSRLKRWFIWAVITAGGGLALCCGNIYSGPIPVNKNLWSLSFVLITSAMAYVLLFLCYFVVDCKKIWYGSPFYETGMNSIFLYIGHFFTYNVFPWHFRIGNMNSHFAIFSEALFGALLWIIIAKYLHCKRKFFTV